MKLDTIEAILDNHLEIAAKDCKTTMEVLDHLFEQERKNRDAAATNRRMKCAAFPVIKTLEEFNFDFQPSIERSVIEDLATLVVQRYMIGVLKHLNVRRFLSVHFESVIPAALAGVFLHSTPLSSLYFNPLCPLQKLK